MAKHIAVLLTAAQARAVVCAAGEAHHAHDTETDDATETHWRTYEKPALDRGVAAIRRAARSEGIDL